MLRFLFIKATVPRAGTSNLFAEEVDVAGFTRKDGTYVAPHRAQRRKKLLTTTAATPPHAADLFTPRPASTQRALDFGISPPAPSAPPVRTDSQTDAQVKEAAPPPASVGRVAELGVPEGTKPAQRKRWNKEANAILLAKTNGEMTVEDRTALARYTGRGGIGDSLNEFYTRPDVAAAMWAMLRNHGFEGGEVLEPSCGTGVFLQTAPADAHVVGVEMDPTSSRIATILHPSHEVRNASLERFATQDGRLFDAVIGNPPFGARGGTLADDKPNIAYADNYFLTAALDKVKDGGLVAMIVPTGVLDAPKRRAMRQGLMCQAEFIGAHRLPNTAFAAAHTEVTSDIVLFRKRPQAIAGALSALTQEQLRAAGVWDQEFLAGTHMTDGAGAGNVMGRVTTKMGQFGQEMTVAGSMDGIADALAEWHALADAVRAPTPDMAAILATLDGDWRAENRVLSASERPPYQVAKPGDIRVHDGIRYILQGEPPRWHRLDAEVPKAVTDALAIGEGIEDLLEGRAKDQALARVMLSEQLDDFVRDHGLPTVNKDLARWLSKPALNPVDEETPEGHRARTERARRRAARALGAVNADGTYSDLVTGHTRSGEAIDFDTAATQLALEAGGFTAEQLAAATGRPVENVVDQLLASPLYAVEANGTTWSTLDDYLSGELWPKYDQALERSQHGALLPGYQPKYAAQAEALEKAIAPQALEDVDIDLRSGFLTPEMIGAFLTEDSAREALASDYRTAATYEVSRANNAWSVRNASGGGVWGLPALVETYLNRDGTRKDDMPKIEAANAELKAWALRSSYRDEIEEAYNRSYRGFRQRAYSDAPIAIPGINPALDVNSYHFSSIRWALEQGKGIIAADVGLGKTGRGLMMAKLAKASGRAKRPTFVVPKSVLANWTASADFWFPGSKVLVIGETTTTDAKGKIKTVADNEATRRAKYQDMQQNDYDFVFISAPAWNDLDVSDEMRDRYVDDDFWVKRAEGLGKEPSAKKLNRDKTKHDQSAAGKQFRSREETVVFDDLGVDMLIMDEAHAYKNLVSARSRFGQSPKFLGGSGESKRAQDTQYKTRLLREQNGGKGVYFLTATPTKNSPLEVYSMLSHIAPEAFDRMGIRNAEDFIDRFCEMKNDLILSVSGEIEEALVVAGFKNLDELREVMRRYIERTTAEQVGLQLPGRDDHQHLVQMTAEQEAVYQGLREQAETGSKSDDTGDAHIFSIMDKMGKASMELSLLGMREGRSPKIEACVAEVKKSLADGKQIVFCDSVPMHDRIVRDLVASGVPREQIAVVNATVTKSSASRQKVSDDFNSGKIRVVVGNTATMGEGVNLQIGTSDIHHLDLPWEPASVQQRNGRGLRQGNKNEAVRIHTYLAKGSFDGYRYQTLVAKKDWQDLLWNGGDRIENLAQEGKMSRDEMLIALAPNPEEARARYETDKEAAKARIAEQHRQQAFSNFERMNQMVGSLTELRARGDESATRRRLEIKAADLRATLRADEHFPHKDLLDAQGPVLIQPTSGTAFKAGVGFKVNDEAPQGYARQGSYVVTDVDPERKIVMARRQGELGSKAIGFPLDDLTTGTSVVDYDAEAEARDFESSLSQDYLPGGGSGASIMDYDRIRRLPADLVARHRGNIERHLRQSIATYKVQGKEFAALDQNGRPKLIPGHEARTAHRLILPDAEGREHAIAGHAELEETKSVENTYPTNGRYSSYGSSRPNGLKPVYKWGGHYQADANPWDATIDHTFGKENRRPMVAASRQKATAGVHAEIAAAPSITAAFSAALRATQLRPYHHPDAGDAWSRSTINALRKRAEELKATGERVDDVLRRNLEKLRHVDGNNYAHRTVGDYLDALKRAPDDRRQAA